MVQMTYLQNRNRVTDVAKNLWLSGSNGGVNFDIGIDIYMLLLLLLLSRFSRVQLCATP